MTTMLGTTQKDKVTGFQGVVIGYCEYLGGCSQALLALRAQDDGTYKVEQHWFDVTRLEQIGDDVLTLDNDKH